MGHLLRIATSLTRFPEGSQNGNETRAGYFCAPYEGIHGQSRRSDPVCPTAWVELISLVFVESVGDGAGAGQVVAHECIHDVDERQQCADILDSHYRDDAL